MLCKLGDFVFSEKDISNIEEVENYPLAEIKKAANHPSYQSVQKENAEIELKGWYLLRSNAVFDNLKDMGRKQEPVRFTTIQGSIKVFITSVRTGKKVFVKGGALKQEFSIKLKRSYE